MSAQSIEYKLSSEATKALPPDACPGLFYPTFAQDGRLIRVRTPGGRLSALQARALVKLLQPLGDPALQVTNRANLQIRGLPAVLPQELLTGLQAVGLAAVNPRVDHLRNIMASPTAGIDRDLIWDTVPMVRALDHYFSSHEELSPLSAKFSVGLDGGEGVAIAPHNDILVRPSQSDCVDLILAGAPGVGIRVERENCIAAIAAISKIYLAASLASVGKRKLRLKQLMAQIGMAELCDRAGLKRVEVNEYSQPLTFAPVGVYPQRQIDLFYVGVALPLGRLEGWQLQGLAELVERFGDGTLRLTPWQNIILPNIPGAMVASVEKAIASLNLHCSPQHPYRALIACAGKTCASSLTDTQADALALASYLESHIILEQPVTIHFSGCEKSCAYHGESDLTLVGVMTEAGAAYQLYGGSRLGSALRRNESSFGHLLDSEIAPAAVPDRVLQLLQRYQQHQRTRMEG